MPLMGTIPAMVLEPESLNADSLDSLGVLPYYQHLSNT